MTKEELYKVTDILNDVLSNYLRGSEAEEVIAKLEESVENSELIKEEPVSEKLAEAAIQYAKSKHTGETLQKIVAWDFKAGANWQKKQDQSIIELAEDHAMFAGMEKMKEEMMAKAVDATVHIDAGGYPYIPQMELYDYDKDIPLAKEGDKYKVVLIKEE